MIHIELYKHGTTSHETWRHEEDQPASLLNPRELLEKFK